MSCHRRNPTEIFHEALANTAGRMESEHTKLVCGLGREVVKSMGRIAERVQKQDGLSLASPIQIVKPDAAGRDEFGFMWRLICSVALRR